MLPEREIKDEFLKLFYHDLKDYDLGNQNRLNLLTLRISSNEFAYSDLVDELFDSVISFCLSRRELERFKNSQGGKKFNAARCKLRDYKSNEGELGEILLYCLLESHLKAPKILSKLEIKTSNNDYVKGADGVHILKVDDKNFQIVFGEAKLDSDLKAGIYDAFRSTLKFLDKKKNKISFEINLINSQLVKEAVDEHTYQYLKKVLIPNANEDQLNLDYSFGIFLGFNIEVEEYQKRLDNNSFRQIVRDLTKKTVIENIDYLKSQLERKELWGHNFYIYVVPFTNLPVVRKELIQALTE